MCSTCGCQNFTIDELVWYHQHCTQCGHSYKSTVEKSTCPVCSSEAVEKLEEPSLPR